MLKVFNDNIRRRAHREPVSRIFGQREFRSLEFLIDSNVLDPRPDSEIVVETAIDLAQRATGSVKVLDIGTGSGCLLLSILDTLPDAYGVGVDIDAAAIQNAITNARRLGLFERSKFIQSVWTEIVNEKYDIIVSNPPYIRTQDIKKLAPKYILSIIDKWKNKGLYPDQVNINKKDLYEKIVSLLQKQRLSR